MSDIAILIVAVIAAFLAFRFVAGLVKFAVIAAVIDRKSTRLNSSHT